MVKNKRAYTLVELIVVMGIAAVIFGMVMASFDSFDSGKKLDQEAEVFKSRIEEIIKKASSGDMENYLCGSVRNTCDATKYILTISNSNEYQLDFYCKCPNTSIFVQSTSPVDTRALLDSITFIPSSGSYTFEEGVQISNQCITLKKGTKTKSIVFSYPGTVGVGSSCP
jgi:prepilin-type N-terminal cleavage/methylation domain-containing protein